MNFLLYIPFPTDEMLLDSGYTIDIFMAGVKATYIRWFHQSSILGIIPSISEWLEEIYSTTTFYLELRHYRMNSGEDASITTTILPASNQGSTVMSYISSYSKYYPLSVRFS